MRKKKRLHIHVFETPGRSATASEALSGTSTPLSNSSGGTVFGNGHSKTTDSEQSPSAGEKEKTKEKKKAGKHKKYYLPMNEALAILEGRTPVYPKEKTLFQKFIGLESVIKSDASIIALKTAAAVSF